MTKRIVIAVAAVAALALRTPEETAQYREAQGSRARQAYWKLLESRKG